MMYLYDNEDNVPMNEESWEHARALGSIAAREPTIEEEPVPFSDPMPDKGCWNCFLYDSQHCMKEWNNLDPDYYVPDRDDKSPEDCCGDWDGGEFIETRRT